MSNGIFGFTESFNGSNWCRICEASSDIIASLAEEKESFLKNKQKYEKETNLLTNGIKESCAFPEILNFHIAENLSMDLMLDVLEGVYVYVLTFILFKFVLKKSISL